MPGSAAPLPDDEDFTLPPADEGHAPGLRMCYRPESDSYVVLSHEVIA